MSNIKLQDLTAIITGTSQYGAGYDTVHVETLLVTDEPISSEAAWYVPNGSTVPPAVLEIFKISNLKMYPQSEATLLNGVDDIKQQALSGNLQEVINDSSRLLLLSILKKIQLNPVPSATNTYLLTYDYKLYPLDGVQVPTFEFQVLLPFDTLILSPGGRVQVTVLTPIGAKINQQETKGTVIPSNAELQEEVSVSSQSRRATISFAYQNDPEFVVKYNY
ncbi:hypothetical protein [Clostridium sp. 'White wine YQ']|uniref:hypothetical protein n=1 Tax=Clostridium sp. 'White wine YQ' TaxID=3027474 RepID=UPI002365454A|nr:hypothetical protein [Clostridium sp. 'White wine YQ']MDD7795909.1 hypothetical protein [Clostridium sp. 'White wine YQ']